MRPLLSKEHFFLACPSASRSYIEATVRKSMEKSGARRSASDRHNAPVFQVDTNSLLIFYMFINFSHS